jgi:O-antigen/teichoic acid export membrane protein
VLAFRPVWDGAIARFLLAFGAKRAVEDFLRFAQDRVDDMWTAARLGDLATGYYTQAHTVARYPLKIISLPVIAVAQSTFSALKDETEALAQAFEFVSSFLARLSFFIGGAVLLMSREFVILYLGEKWLPLLNVLRIMVLYMMIEPVKQVISALFSAIGRPELGVKARAWQLGLLVLGLLVFAGLLPWGIEGVALAVNVSVLAGLVLMALLLRPHLAVGWQRILLQPVLAVAGVGMATHFIFQAYPLATVWLSALVKGLAWALLYVGIEVLSDRPFLKEMRRTGRKYLRKA